MYFDKIRGRQHLDLRGDLILTVNPELVRARVRSAGPYKVNHGSYVMLRKLNVFQRFFLWVRIFRFIVFPPEPLSRETFEREGL